MAMSNLTVRFATAGVAVPLMLLLLFAGPAWGWLLFVMIAAAAGSIELFGMTHRGDRVAAAAGVLCTWAMMLSIYFFDREPRAIATVALLIAFGSIALTLVRLGDIQSAALRLTTATFGPLWLGGGVGALAALRLRGEPYGAGYVILALALAWLSDTGGYFAGRFLGKRKLYPKVSPKKTIAGAVGGVLGGTLGALAFRYFLVPTLPLVDGIVLFLVASFLGQLGDLGESVLKRSVGVKDSGGIVPGHGGMLDRIDAAVITSPLVLLYLLWWT